MKITVTMLSYYLNLKERYEGTLDVDNLYLWALALKDLGKVDVALKKVEEAIQTIQTEVKII